MRSANPTGRGVHDLPTGDSDARRQPGKWGGAVRIGEGWAAQDEKTSIDQRPARTDEATGQQQKVNRSGRESMHMVGGARETGTGDETSPFFSESVLCTEHDGV